MNHDYCVVGPRFVLYSDPDRTTKGALRLRAEERPGHRIAWMRAALRQGEAVRIVRPECDQPLRANDVAEMLRLFARVCAHFWDYRFPLEIDPDASVDAIVRDALTADGFSPVHGTVWQRPAVPFTRRGAKARTMDEVYDDLFSVPWNFVPREWDVFGTLIHEAPTTSLSVLDLGCGVGKNVQPLASRGFAVYGVDPAHAAVRRCRAIVPDPNRFVVGTAVHLPWGDATFDRVLDVGALHCMPAGERQLAMREISRVLRPGGLMYSRFFTPRPPAWLQLQPMAVDQFGLTVDDVRALLNLSLVCESITESGPAIYAKASQRGDLR